MYPSMIALAITGLTVMIFIILFAIKYKNGEIKLLSTYEQLTLIIFVGILIGVHGLQHAYSEVNFGYNPLECKNKYIINN